MVHFQGDQLCLFHSCLPYKLRSSHKGKNLLPSEQIYSVKCKPHFGRLRFSGKRKEVKIIVSLRKHGVKRDGSVPIPLNKTDAIRSPFLSLFLKQ